ncbi:hypothetical protein [Shewanella sp.]|uniref:hypothetical protein n=1 Tax=Shewanella sp. TaxID=50422 RepID=UPI004053865D
MNRKWLISIALATTFFANVSVSANETSLQALGQSGKNSFYKTASTQTTPSFPAIYVYSVKTQQFLSQDKALAYLGTLDSQPLWKEATINWVKDSTQFSTSNTKLSQAVPAIKFDRDYVIYYDNLPGPMLEQFKAMEPNLIEKDKILKSVLSLQSNSRTYTTY